MGINFVTWFPYEESYILTAVWSGHFLGSYSPFSLRIFPLELLTGNLSKISNQNSPILCMLSYYNMKIHVFFVVVSLVLFFFFLEEILNISSNKFVHTNPVYLAIARFSFSKDEWIWEGYTFVFVSKITFNLFLC